MIILWIQILSTEKMITISRNLSLGLIQSFSNSFDFSAYEGYRVRILSNSGTVREIVNCCGLKFESA